LPNTIKSVIARLDRAIQHQALREQSVDRLLKDVIRIRQYFLSMILDHPVKPDDDLLGNAKVKGLSRNS
jgi:hypothetical protein